MTLNAAWYSANIRRLELAALKTTERLVDLVFPPTCANCGRVDARFCAICRRALARYPHEISHQAVDHLDRLSATGKQQGLLANAVKAFKYEDATNLCDILAERLVLTLREQDWRIDAVSPVPLHADRLLERGYNQAALLGEQLAQTLGIRFEPGLLRRIRSTSQQAQLSSSERLRNVVGAFQADPAVRGLSVLLVDDVVTTGATLSECAAALRARDAADVYGIAVSHA